MFRNRLLFAIPAVMAIVLPRPLQAQRCAGAPVLVAESFRVAGGLVAGPGATGQEAEAATGMLASGRQLHARVVLTRVTRSAAFDAPARDGRVDPAYGVEGELGGEVVRGTTGRLSVCPVLGMGLVSGPEVTSGAGSEELETEALTHTAALGAWLGVATRESGAVVLIPAIGVRLVHGWGEVTNDGTVGGVRIDEVEEIRDTWALVSVAVGGTLYGRFVLRPQLDVPVGREGEDLLLHLTAGILMGR